MSILPRRTILTIARRFTKGAVTKISPNNTNSNQNIKRTSHTAALTVTPEKDDADAVHSNQGIPGDAVDQLVDGAVGVEPLVTHGPRKLDQRRTAIQENASVLFRNKVKRHEFFKLQESPPVVEQSSQYKITPTPGSSKTRSTVFDAEHYLYCFCGYLEIAKLKKELEKSGFVHCSGSMMKKLLLFCGADLEELEKDSAIKFKQIAFQGLLTDDAIKTIPNNEMEKKKNGKSLELCDSYQFVPAKVQAVSQLQSHEIVSNPGEGSTFCKVSFRRCNYRDWPLPPLTYAESSVPEAMSILYAHMLPANHHAQQNIERKHKITINDQALIRIHRKLHTDESSSPTPEGIHQDGSEISSVTLIGLNGVKSGGESRIWKLDTPTGNYTEDEFNKGYLKDKLLLNHALQNPWESVIFNDRKVKHEARAFDGERPCSRDVIVNFCRKPLKGGYDKRVIDYSLMSV